MHDLLVQIEAPNILRPFVAVQNPLEATPLNLQLFEVTYGMYLVEDVLLRQRLLYR